MVKSKRKRYKVKVWIVFKEPENSWHTVEHNLYFAYREVVDLNNIKNYLESRHKGLELILEQEDTEINILMAFDINKMDKLLLGLYTLDRDKFRRRVCYGIGTHI